MRNKSVLQEAQDIQRAVELIQLGARMQMLEAETSLSRERLLKLYKEVKGVSPPKGMLPFSTDWFMSWQPNIHASLFLALYQFIRKNAGLADLEAITQAFKLYNEHVQSFEMEQVLSLTRAWTLIRFIDARLLQTARCTSCGGEFVVHAFDPTRDYVCGLCHVPSRAGKTRKVMEGLPEGGLS
ncbi:flagellar transcriptional regulator FlhC [Zoogloea sp.]|uniref:flagellar transcriptional regulator FlhC n=1 Tax=Zoogloea sp. TaxID=49181 RepID=UPI002602A1C6|nr:flagellar transcriptional regulator FlhC [Zoogloea sp.]MDD3354059.1 flagellar transcriptional regulator FlhC [Zoogloea sp.]